jgi:hypothetical protein
MMSIRDFARIGIAHFMLHPKAVVEECEITQLDRI